MKKKSESVENTNWNSISRVGRAVIPMLQSLVPLAYDIIIIVSYVITIGELSTTNTTPIPHRLL